MRQIPDQSGEVEIRLRIMPWLHDEVMVYGREHGVRSTTERYCLALVHLLRLVGRLPQLKGYNAAICGVDVQTERRIQHCVDVTGCTREEAVAVFAQVGGEMLERSLYAPLRKRQVEKEGAA
jgi:hypothetical protein